MFPRVYQTLRANTSVSTLVGERIGAHGEIEQTEGRPYVTYQTVSGVAHDNLSDAPGSDFTTVQIDCYATTQATAKLLALSVREALDAELIVNRVILTGREPDTRLFRVGIEADFIERRPVPDQIVIED